MTISTNNRPPIACDIGSGIKTLTRAALNGDSRSGLKPIPSAQKIYDDGVQAGATWDEIETALKAAAPGFAKRPLQPVNTLYFVFAQSRCSIPGVASMVLEKYGETRADGVRRVYSFPVVFFGDDIPSVCAQGFGCWKMGKLHRWSQMLPADGRHCMAKEELKPSPKARRKRWGGRTTLDLGRCDPNNCALFESGDCAHHAELYFRIPGIPTGSMFFALKTKSIYSLLDFAGDPDDPNSHGVLDYVRRDFGRIAGLFGGKPLFTVTKTLDEVSRIDWQKGRQLKEKKEIIKLVTAGVDTIALLEQQADVMPTTEPAKMLETDKPEINDIDCNAPEEPGDDEDHKEINDHEENKDIAILRKSLIATVAAFDPPWTPDDISEWLLGNGYKLDAVHDKNLLIEIINKLGAKKG